MNLSCGRYHQMSRAKIELVTFWSRESPASVMPEKETYRETRTLLAILHSTVNFDSVPPDMIILTGVR